MLPLTIMRRFWLGTASLALAAGCSNAAPSPVVAPPHVAPHSAAATSNPQPTAPEPAAPLLAAPPAPAEEAAPPPEAPVDPIKIKVKLDKAVLVVPGDTPTPIIYLHGRCGDPTAFSAWAATGKKYGTIISFTGDQKCKHGTRTQWSVDDGALDRRITRAIEAVKTELGIEIDGSRRIVIGYSQGSLRAEALATRFPERYPRAVLIGGPRAPRETSLGKSEAVLIMVGDHDAREHLREATQKLEKRGRRVRYLELKDARHGEYGSAPDATMKQGFDWLLDSAT
jgi:predicted esterase